MKNTHCDFIVRQWRPDRICPAVKSVTVQVPTTALCKAYQTRTCVDGGAQNERLIMVSTRMEKNTLEQDATMPKCICFAAAASATATRIQTDANKFIIRNNSFFRLFFLITYLKMSINIIGYFFMSILSQDFMSVRRSFARQLSGLFINLFVYFFFFCFVRWQSFVTRNSKLLIVSITLYLKVVHFFKNSDSSLI